VVIDASWVAARHRERARAAARGAAAPVVELALEAPGALAAARIRERAARGGDPSDATPEIAARLAAAFEPWPEARRIDAARPPEAVLQEAAAIARDPGP
jgi:predicted kinase